MEIVPGNGGVRNQWRWETALADGGRPGAEALVQVDGEGVKEGELQQRREDRRRKHEAGRFGGPRSEGNNSRHQPEEARKDQEEVSGGDGGLHKARCR